MTRHKYSSFSQLYGFRGPKAHHPQFSGVSSIQQIHAMIVMSFRRPRGEGGLGRLEKAWEAKEPKRTRSQPFFRFPPDGNPSKSLSLSLTVFMLFMCCPPLYLIPRMIYNPSFRHLVFGWVENLYTSCNYVSVFLKLVSSISYLETLFCPIL